MSGWLRRFLAKVRGDPRQGIEREESLVTCRGCGASMVVPVAWRECDGAHWWMYLRCGECGHRREVVVTDADAQRYECALDSGVAEIERALEQINRDLIDAGDFAD